MATKAALWLRVSTDEQTTSNQRAELEAWAVRRGWEIARVYDLAGVSAWKGRHREPLDAVVDAAKRGEFQVLLIWALDRLTREGIPETLEAVHRLSRAGVMVVSLKEPWLETAGPLRDLLLSITGWVAQQESQRRSERTKAGVARVKAAGVVLGRPSVVGLVDLTQVERLKADGLGWATIASQHPAIIPTGRGGRKRPSAGTVRAAWLAFKNGVGDLPGLPKLE